MAAPYHFPYPAPKVCASMLLRWWCVALWCLAGVILAGCAPPIQVERVSGGKEERAIDANVNSTGELTESSRIVLRRENLSERWGVDPDDTIARLHRVVAAGAADPDAVFALAEVAYRRAVDIGKPSYSLAAAVYAYAFLFPDDPSRRPSGFDPHLRAACVIYNHGLARAFASADHSRVDLRSGRYELPFGSMDITFDPSGAWWGNVRLSDFTPAYDLRVSGLETLYRRPGIGASLAASANLQGPQSGWQIEPNIKIPVTALLRIDGLNRDLAQGRSPGQS